MKIVLSTEYHSISNLNICSAMHRCFDSVTVNLLLKCNLKKKGFISVEFLAQSKHFYEEFPVLVPLRCVCFSLDT